MDFYKAKLFIAQVDKNDNVTGKVERWEAHKKGILHRGFTVALFYGDKIILQHRKHPVFDGVYDLTCSSHPYFIREKLQSVEEAVLNCLEREWNGSTYNGVSIKYKGKAYYKAKDNLSEYQEHEVCHFYIGQVSPAYRQAGLSPNFDFAYGFSLLTKKELMNPKLPLKKSFAPWVQGCLDLL